MAAWTRDTLWRQGCLVERHLLEQVGVVLASDQTQYVVVISHDCDIANDDLALEPCVEVIPAVPVDQPEGGVIHGQSPRKLHLVYDIGEGDRLCVELRACDKESVRKTELAGCAPDLGASLCSSRLAILRNWLATRYRRHAFPDALAERLRPSIDWLKRAGKRHPNEIIGFWLSFDPVGEVEEDEPYELDFYVVYSIDEPGAAAVAAGVAADIKNRLNVPGLYVGKCSAYSEIEFTLHDMRRTTQLDFDHLSYRQFPPGPTL